MPRKPGEMVMEDRKKKAARRYNAVRPARHDFYHTWAWKQLRRRYLMSHPLCERCERLGLVVQAELVHHRVEIADGGGALDWDNLEALCRSCHNKAHGGGKKVAAI